MKRILTIQDVSCVGKCSLTVALPIISAMGVETAVIPTAVLSTHTMFSGFTFHDLTGEIKPITDHWKKEKIGFDAIYTGYLGSFEQLALVGGIFDDFKTKDNIIIVDPVMGDAGKLYKGFSQEFAFSMAKLCGKADVIVPNLTEAAYMLGEDYLGDNYTESDVKTLLKRLCALGTKTAVLTGVSLEKGRVGVMALDSASGEYFYYDREHLPAAYHGTGDIYASAFTGAVSRGYSVNEALKIATDFTVECIALTLRDKNGRDYGVNFEEAIPYLVKRISE